MKCRSFISLVSLALLCGGTPALAQQDLSGAGSGDFARMVVIAPKPGQAAAFRDGYQRHLEWHRKADDPWTWYGWSFVLGDRLGLFMDGTFGHTTADFDSAVKPAEDSADNALNVTPYAAFLSHGIYERLDALSAGAPLPDTSEYLALTTYSIVPGREQAFETLLKKSRDRLESSNNVRYTWLRLRMGGQSPQYLLLRPVATFGAAAAVPDFFQSRRSAETGADAAIAGTVDAVRNELLSYEPTLSYHP